MTHPSRQDHRVTVKHDGRRDRDGDGDRDTDSESAFESVGTKLCLQALKSRWTPQTPLRGRRPGTAAPPRPVTRSQVVGLNHRLACGKPRPEKRQSYRSHGHSGTDYK